MKGFFRFVLICALLGIAFMCGQSFYEENHSYVSDRGVNFDKIVSDTGEGAETLFEDVTNYFN